MKRVEILLPVLALFLLSSSGLQADPRWWWDDAIVADQGGTIAAVDIDTVSTYSGAGASNCTVSTVAINCALLKQYSFLHRRS